MSSIVGRTVKSKYDDTPAVVFLGEEGTPALAVLADESNSHPYLFIEKYNEDIPNTVVQLATWEEAYHEYTMAKIRS